MSFAPSSFFRPARCLPPDRQLIESPLREALPLSRFLRSSIDSFLLNFFFGEFCVRGESSHSPPQERSRLSHIDGTHGARLCLRAPPWPLNLFLRVPREVLSPRVLRKSVPDKDFVILVPVNTGLPSPSPRAGVALRNGILVRRSPVFGA